ncbi:MAG: hypothetical protein E7291_08070 [Lachnospiraceae bacterium]|nr:hypothetical protein [Lachnospiraceae bacterium]
MNKTIGDIKERGIVLYGNVDENREFLHSYNQKLNIKGIMVDDRNDIEMQSFSEWNTQAFLFKEMQLTEELIVICDKANFGQLQNRLEHAGKCEYRDYISAECVEALLFEKKLLVCMGTHLLKQVALLLRNCKKIAEEYSVVYFAESDIKAPYRNRMQEQRHLGRLCDVYVYSDCEKKRYSSKKLEREALKQDCKMISVADYGFGGYFPQYERNRDAVSRYMLGVFVELGDFELKSMDYETNAFHKTDREIEKLCLQGIELEEAIKKLLDVQYFKAEDVADHFAEEVRRFKELEVHADIKLGAFIEQHQKECLCRNLNEWNEPIISYVVEQLARILEIPPVQMNTEECRLLIEEESGTELPVYPGVEKALGLQERLKDKKYKITTYAGSKYLDIEECIRYHASYLYRAWDFMKFTKMNEKLRDN